MLDLIDRFREQGTRDELGIGTVRDALADTLFPGTSTIQTRAKYYLFVPWVYLSLEKRGVASNQAAAKARIEETRLIEALLRSDDTDGVIGKDVRAKLKRLPSSIYWRGTYEWGIRRFPGSQEQYHRSLDAFHKRSKTFRRSDDGEPVGGDGGQNWHPDVPAAPAGFPNEASLALTSTEAEYLRERILTSRPETLLAFLVDEGRLGIETDFPWEHPQYEEFPSDVREELDHARNFSETMHGAVLLYNVLLERKADLPHGHESAFSTWAELVEERMPLLKTWDRKRFWKIVEDRNPHIPIPTSTFINTWLDLVLSNKPSTLLDNGVAQGLVHHREVSLKRSRSRLENKRALELWSGASGTARLNYRWAPVVQDIVSDILKGLARVGVERA